MSHWRAGKLKIKCSISVLQRALLKVMPKWREYIKVDESGKLPIFNSYTRETKKGYHIVIPGGNNPMGGKVPGVRAAPGLNYADVGFRREEDGSWSVEIDPMGLPYEIKNLEGVIGREVAAMRSRAIARAKGFSIAKDELEGNKRKIRLIVPVGEEFKIHA